MVGQNCTLEKMAEKLNILKKNELGVEYINQIFMWSSNI